MAGRTPWPNVAGREKSTSTVAAAAHSRTVTKTEGQRRQAALPRQGINPDVTTEAGGVMVNAHGAKRPKQSCARIIKPNVTY